MFLSLGDAKMRLENVVVRHKGEPIYIHNVEQPRVSYILHIEYLRTQIAGRVNLKDKGVDLSPVPLGNMNHEGNCFFASRAPLRMWKQGLHRDSFICKSMERGFVGIPINCKALVNTINNEYPSIEEGWKMIEQGQMASVAFSRNFSLMEKRTLVFNSKLIVGSLHKDLVSFHLENTYLYLKEHLQSSMIRKAHEYPGNF